MVFPSPEINTWEVEKFKKMDSRKGIENMIYFKNRRDLYLKKRITIPHHP